MNKIVGELIFTLSVATNGYLPADGRCLPIKLYPELSEVLHDGGNWPYGRCNFNSGFRLPDLTSKDKNKGHYIIRVDP